MPEQTSALVPTRVTVDTVRHDPEVAAYVERANESLGVLGYTEHGVRHASLTSRIAYNILRRLGYPERECELAAIAAYLHDIGNLVSRLNHEHTGALLAGAILQRLGMDPAERAVVMSAIGNHEESHGQPVSSVGAAVILADKSDVHRSRVRNPDPVSYTHLTLPTTPYV